MLQGEWVRGGAADIVFKSTNTATYTREGVPIDCYTLSMLYSTHKEMSMMGKRIDYTGKKFGHLTMLQFLKGNGNGKHATWLARCDCGNTAEVVGKSVARGSVKTCGKCQLHRDLIARRTQGVRSANRQIAHQYRKLYARYVNGALRRGIGWDLTPEYCVELFKKACTYCGDTKSGKYSGIDRIDSDKPYTLDNTVSCCSDCNYMKRTLNLRDFLDKIYKIADRMVEIKKELDKNRAT